MSKYLKPSHKLLICCFNLHLIADSFEVSTLKQSKAQEKSDTLMWQDFDKHFFGVLKNKITCHRAV